ncbi:rhodanese-like domain-containing protein [Gorillibacterium sp. sgz5001074]|uniref:rhodanese-like domain-containing protein n=1 Tax=Gorillibacterium sp. sgz5001074 TaxID=3446695 RepID=UPI003F679928
MPEMEAITPEQVRERLERGEALNVVDVREYDEVAQGMIPGAKHIPLGELPERLAELSRDDEVILVCRSGGRSSRAYDYLQQHGYTGLKNMTGGMLAYGQP